ncbi:uncharacterized protein LOC143286344 [Babylonia areolata]|uniref:uncharacterized protein LOC143286344 n=1 Tax=Babylonia areolata TaxID=304850 RepID=UPI003FD61C75
MCTCNVTISAELDQTFIDTANEYLRSCHNVSSHNARNSTRLVCMEGKPLPVGVPDDPVVDLEVEDTISRAEIEELNERLLQQCSSYAHCSEVYQNAVQMSAYVVNHQQKLASVCL